MARVIEDPPFYVSKAEAADNYESDNWCVAEGWYYIRYDEESDESDVIGPFKTKAQATEDLHEEMRRCNR